MDECTHYTLRGEVAKLRETDPRKNYPFTLPQEMNQEQIKSLLPQMDSIKCKPWNCLHCLREFMEQDCPHDQLTIKSAPSVPAPKSDGVLITRNNNSAVEKINSIEVLMCTGSKNATTKDQNERPIVMFDLNEAPSPEPCGEPLVKKYNALGIEELVVANNAERCSTELVPVYEKQTINPEDAEPEASSQVPYNYIGNSNVYSSPEIDADDEIITGRNKTSDGKKARKYHSILYLNREGERDRSQNIPSLQTKRMESKIKKKMLQSGTREQGVGNMISHIAQDASEKNIENRTVCYNLPLEQNPLLARTSLSPQPTSNGKRKYQETHDPNGNSDAIVPNSTEKDLQNEARRIHQLKKRRIFCSVERTPLTNADRSQRVESDADQSQRVQLDGVDVNSQVIPQCHASHKNDKNDPSSSKRKESLISPVGDLGNSRPIRVKKATSKGAYHLTLGRKRKNKNSCESRGIAGFDKKTPDSSSPVVVEKELVLQDEPVPCVAKDVPMPCLENDNTLGQIIKSMLLKRGDSRKKLKVDSPTNKKQHGIPISENGTSSPIQTKKSAGKDEDKLTLEAPQQKNKGIGTSNVNEVKKKGRPRKVLTSGSGSRKEGGYEQPEAIFGNELVLREGNTVNTISPNEEALRMLSIVASKNPDFEVLSDTRLDHVMLPILEEFHEPPIRDVLKMGYGGCIEVTNPADHFLIDGDGERYKLGPEDLPLRPHRLLPAKRAVPVASPTVAVLAD